jgi:hypothetical protein
MWAQYSSNRSGDIVWMVVGAATGTDTGTTMLGMLQESPAAGAGAPLAVGATTPPGAASGAVAPIRDGVDVSGRAGCA